MKMEKFAASIFFFIISALLFPTLQTEISNSTITGNTASIIEAFPYIFLGLSAFCIIWFGVAKK